MKEIDPLNNTNSLPSLPAKYVLTDTLQDLNVMNVNFFLTMDTARLFYDVRKHVFI